MTEGQLYEIRDALSKLCADVSEFIQTEVTRVSGDAIETKSRNSLVSYVDKQAEEMLVKGLSVIVPKAGFITEEETVEQGDSGEYTWVVDPLDGTTNFLYRIPHFSISVALMHMGNPLVACVYEIMQDTSYTAIKNLGAWENGSPIKVQQQKEKAEAMVVTGFPYIREDRLDERLAIFKFCILNYRGVRRLGSAALDLAYVASGKFDIYYENTLNIWDIAAGALLVEEAGGLLSDFSGKKDYLNTGGIIASVPSLHQEILDCVSAHLD